MPRHEFRVSMAAEGKSPTAIIVLDANGPVRQDELDIYTICKHECPHHLVSYSIIKLESTSLARQASIKFF